MESQSGGVPLQPGTRDLLLAGAREVIREGGDEEGLLGLEPLLSSLRQDRFSERGPMHQ